MCIDTHYKNAIAQHLGKQASHIYLYWKGRVGLYALLKAMHINTDDEIILPAFTCVVVPNAIIYSGAKPIYVDVQKDTLNCSLNDIKSKLTPQTKCIIIQNTFGLSSEVEEIVAFARAHQIYTIEDCTHGFGGTYNNKPNGVYCDASFYSTQWNKPFSTGLGGIVLINNPELKQAIENVNTLLKKPGLKNCLMLNVLAHIKAILLTDTTYWMLMRTYRFLSKYGFVVGSSSNTELVSQEMPSNYFLGSSKVQAKHGLKALKSLDMLLSLRKQNGLTYNDFFRAEGKFHYKETDISNHAFLKYPIFVKDRDAFLIEAEKAKIRMGDWFNSPLHPIQCSLKPWQLDIKTCPVAVHLSQTILNLPTDTNNITKVLAFLKTHSDKIY